MDSSYSWHPGAFRLAASWAVPTSLQPDEILSSWLIRTALANGCDPLAFVGVVWPMQRVWAMDLDRQPRAALLEVLGALSGAAPALLGQATLLPVARRVLLADPPANQSWPWILSVGPRNRRRVGRMQYCPVCLAEDKDPFFRLQWRFAWHCICVRHGCQLLETCPHCGASLEPHRAKASDRVDSCTACRESLWRGAPWHNELPSARQLQIATDNTIKVGQATYLGAATSVRAWFAIMAFYVGLVRRTLRPQTAAMEVFASRINSEALHDLGFVPLEKLTLRQRTGLLDCVGKLMSMSFDRLLSELSNTGLSRQALFPDGVPCGSPLLRIAEALPDRRVTRTAPKRFSSGIGQFRPRSQREVDRMMKALHRRTALASDT
ncbi:TniQ family protein [Uliginosibacterium sp. sgz301328]|uniref:TniQ family protein n=1 Tax=Uliginosibacterium sp. sgz301328 TaxID=3243764 RepID=UPI00359D1DAF